MNKPFGKPVELCTSSNTDVIFNNIHSNIFYIKTRILLLFTHKYGKVYQNYMGETLYILLLCLDKNWKGFLDSGFAFFFPFKFTFYFSLFILLFLMMYYLFAYLFRFCLKVTYNYLK